MNIFFLYMPQKFQNAKKFCHVTGNFSLYTKITLFFHCMTQKISGLLKNFRIAMLPFYRGFFLSAHIHIVCLFLPGRLLFCLRRGGNELEIKYFPLSPHLLAKRVVCLLVSFCAVQIRGQNMQLYLLLQALWPAVAICRHHYYSYNSCCRHFGCKDCAVCMKLQPQQSVQQNMAEFFLQMILLPLSAVALKVLASVTLPNTCRFKICLKSEKKTHKKTLYMHHDLFFFFF